jgi:hypothetical protein
VPGGATALICVGPRTEKLVAGVPPKETALALLRFVPVIVTTVPPAVGPELGLSAPTVAPDV